MFPSAVRCLLIKESERVSKQNEFDDVISRHNENTQRTNSASSEDLISVNLEVGLLKHCEFVWINISRSVFISGRFRASTLIGFSSKV